MKKQHPINLDFEPDDKLLACPFCAGCDLELCNTHTACYWVHCRDCGVEMHGEAYGTKKISSQLTRADHKRAKASALKKWNTRLGIYMVDHPAYFRAGDVLLSEAA